MKDLIVLAAPCWSNPDDPAKVTAFDPGYWLTIALAFGATLVGMFGLCMNLARL